MVERPTIPTQRPPDWRHPLERQRHKWRKVALPVSALRPTVDAKPAPPQPTEGGANWLVIGAVMAILLVVVVVFVRALVGPSAGSREVMTELPEAANPVETEQYLDVAIGTIRDSVARGSWGEAKRLLDQTESVFRQAMGRGLIVAPRAQEALYEARMALDRYDAGAADRALQSAVIAIKAGSIGPRN